MGGEEGEAGPKWTQVLMALTLKSPGRQDTNCKRGTPRMGKSKSTLPPSLPEIPFLLTQGERTSGPGCEALQLQSP